MNPTKKNFVSDTLFQALINQYAEALIITDENEQPVLDGSGRPRVFSSVARATPHLRPGDKVVLDKG